MRDSNGDDTKLTAHTETSAASEPAAADAAATEADCFEVCLSVPRVGFALVPCENARFCASCANRMATVDS